MSYATTSTYKAVKKPNPALANVAVNRCCKAWKRAYRAKYDHGRYAPSASDDAADAYCAALPPLTSRENCRDFIACIAYGIVIRAIAEKDGGKLIYAAQVALSSFANEKDPQKPPHSAKNQPVTRTNSKGKP